jgi:2-polyprenyl-6-hydroxyphenyl methylase/3-demethylubiquinone-9 3-methyltransferase
MNDAEKRLKGLRFAFGANWKHFLETLNDQRIEEAERSMRDLLRLSDMEGKTFLDIGCGSGLFSLVARRLGAEVTSFDYDPISVECASFLKERYCVNDDRWKIQHGSVLDQAYIAGIGKYDVVYSWGVLHHTGDMWKAMDLVCNVVKPGGKLCLAIYNDIGWPCKIWRSIKKLYCQLPVPLRFLVVVPSFVWIWLPSSIKDILKGVPFRTWKNYGQTRGMSPWRDVIDWVGGYPYEVARPEQIFNFFRGKGFKLCVLTTSYGLGNNEFVFERDIS